MRSSVQCQQHGIFMNRPKSYGVEVRGTLDKLRARSCSRHVLTGDWRVAMLQDTYKHYTGYHIVINMRGRRCLYKIIK